MSGYIGASPVPQATQHRQAFTATAGQTSFATAGYQAGYLDVYLNGIKLTAEDYVAENGSDIVLTTGAALDDTLEVVAYSTFEVLNQTFTGTTTVADLELEDATPRIRLTDTDGTDKWTTISEGNGNTYYISRNGANRGQHIWEQVDGGVYTHAMRLNSSGALLHGTTTAGSAGAGDIVVNGGIYLGGTAAANKLDDYEEGTWTPTVVSGTITTSPACTYTKIGRLVHLTGANLQFSDYTSTATLQIENLPFTSSTGSMTGSAMAQHRDNNIGLTPFISNSLAAVKFYYSSSTVAFSPARHNTFNNASGNIYFSIVYLTDA